MKTIGLIGGMSWESSLVYYRIINEVVRDRLGGLHSAKSIMISPDFAEIEILQKEGRWDEATLLMIEIARQVERSGADFLVMCTNTMHRMADAVQAAIRIPLLHIADATAGKIEGQGLKRVGLLGTKFTMEEDFYRGRLAARHGLDVLIPDDGEREVVHRVIYDELVMGAIKPESKVRYVEIMNRLIERGAQGIILGCTEIGLLVGRQDLAVPIFDTTLIHATVAAEFALSAETAAIHLMV